MGAHGLCCCRMVGARERAKTITSRRVTDLIALVTIYFVPRM